MAAPRRGGAQVKVVMVSGTCSVSIGSSLTAAGARVGLPLPLLEPLG